MFVWWGHALVVYTFVSKLLAPNFLNYVLLQLYLNLMSVDPMRASSMTSSVLSRLFVVFFNTSTSSLLNVVCHNSASPSWIQIFTDPSRLQSTRCCTLQFWHLTDSPDSSPTCFLQILQARNIFMLEMNITSLATISVRICQHLWSHKLLEGCGSFSMTCIYVSA